MLGSLRQFMQTLICAYEMRYGPSSNISPRRLVKAWLLARDFNETISLEKRNHGGPEMEWRCSKFRYWVENNGPRKFLAIYLGGKGKDGVDSKEFREKSQTMGLGTLRTGHSIAKGA